MGQDECEILIVIAKKGVHKSCRNTRFRQLFSLEPISSIGRRCVCLITWAGKGVAGVSGSMPHACVTDARVCTKHANAPCKGTRRSIAVLWITSPTLSSARDEANPSGTGDSGALQRYAARSGTSLSFVARSLPPVGGSRYAGGLLCNPHSLLRPRTASRIALFALLPIDEMSSNA